jgi:hypothetical protein
MQNQMNRQTSVGTGWGFGVFLIMAGIFFLVARFLPFDLGQYGWPLLVILAGIAFLAIGLVSRSSAGFVVPGSIVTSVGLILAVQNAFGLWATWTYAWALVFPFAVGVGIALLGMQLGQPEQVRVGKGMAGAGIVLFLLFGAFFEGVLQISGRDLSGPADIIIPVVLIFGGVVLIVLRAAAHPGRPIPPPAPPTPGDGGAA